MSETFVSKTGLIYYHGRLMTVVATKEELQDVNETLSGIIAEGGQPNTIEGITVNGDTIEPDGNKTVALSVPTVVNDLTDGASYATKEYVDENGGKIDVIKVNGATQSITDKVVDIAVPTQVSDLSDGNTLATIEYVDENGGKIDVIQVNGVDQSIYEKSVNIAVPVNVSELNNDSGFQTSDDVESAINTALDGITGIDYSVVEDLPDTGKKGVIYLVANNGSNNSNSYDEYIYLSHGFEKIGTTEVDLSGYLTESDFVAITTAEIDEIINGE